MPCCRTCLALAVGLWGLWILALGASLFFAFYAMWLAGLSLPVAALVAAVGASVGVGAYVRSALEKLGWLFAAVRELGPDKCRLDGGFSSRLGVEVYMCLGWRAYGSAFDLPKRRIVVDNWTLSKEELEAVVYHELSHVRRRDGVLSYAVEGAAKASFVAVAFQLALAAGLGNWAYFAAAAAAAFALAREATLLATGKGEVDLLGRGFLLLMLSAASAQLSAHVPPGPPPQIGLLEAVAAALASAGAFLAARLSDFADELLSDVESALAVGPRLKLNFLERLEKEERETFEKLREWFRERGWKFPTFRYRLYSFLAMYPPAAVRVRLIRLCAK